MKIIKRILFFAVVGIVALTAYDYYRLGYHTLPDMPDGAWPLNFSNKTRAIMIGIPDERLERKYIATPMADIPKWFEDAWSSCREPTNEEAEEINTIAPPDRGMRLDALCSIDADGDIIHTAVIYSVPRL